MNGTIYPAIGLYLDLLKLTLTRYAFGGIALPWRIANRDATPTFDASQRAEGRDWPEDAETMIGLARLDNLEACVTDVIRQEVPGDLIETGVWRGGACIFMRAILKAHGIQDRTVWVADSFAGLPQPEAGRTEDAEDGLWRFSILAVSQAQVRENFARYGLLDEQVRFLPGWFADTLPTAEVEQIAVMRLDGDMYDSTMVALRSLYPKLSVGGFVIVDDYDAVRGCKRAVDDFRAEHGIRDEMHQVDWSCHYWQRSA